MPLAEQPGSGSSSAHPLDALKRRVVIAITGVATLFGGIYLVAGLVTGETEQLGIAGLGAGIGLVGGVLMAVRRHHVPALGAAAVYGLVVASYAAPTDDIVVVGMALAAVAGVSSLLVERRSHVYHGAMAIAWVAQALRPGAEAITLANQVGLYASMALGLGAMIESQRRTSERYRDLFDRAPISLWEEDFSVMADWLADLRAGGVTDIGAFFEEHPEQVDHAMRMVEVRAVNRAAAALIGVGDVSEVLGPINPDTFTDETRPGFIDQVRAVWDGQMAMGTEIKGMTVGGQPLDCLLDFAAARDPRGEPDYSKVIVSITDVSHTRSMEAALRSQEERLRAVVTSAPIILWALDREGTFTLSVGSGLEILGLEGDQVVGRNALDYYADDPGVVAHLERALRGHAFSALVERPQVTWNVQFRPIFDGDGRPNGTIAVSTDVTESRRMENALEDSERRYRTVVQGASDLIYTLDSRARVAFVSPSVEAVLGYTEEQVVGGGIRDFLHPDDLGSVLNAVKVTSPGETTPPVRHRIRHADGSWRVMEAIGTSVAGDAGVGEWVVNARDVTDQVAAARALEESEGRFRFLAENSSDLISRHARDGTVLWCSPSSSAIVGYEPAELIGRSIFELMLAEDKAAFIEGHNRLLAGEAVGPLEFRILTRGGGYVWLETTSRIVRDPETGEIEVQAAGRDVTGRKEALAALEMAKAEAEAATRAKSELLANVSHEIRTPMSAVLGMTELALETDLTTEQRDYLAAVHGSAESLLTLINDLLDLAKMEAGRLELSAAPFDVRAVVEEAVGVLRIRAAGKAIGYRLDVEESVPRIFVGDASRLRQVLVNLVGNAVKFTDTGEVAVRAWGAADADERTTLHFEVTDTGVGIAPDKLGVIFDSFAQADGSMTRRFGGTGLGLSICRELVEAMGGTIEVESAQGEGSTFRFSVRQAARSRKTPASSQNPHRSSALTALRVLLADDSATNRTLASRMLERRGHEVVAVGDGKAALDAFDSTFDVVLMDVQMPVMDGLAATRAIRSREHGDRVPIVAITAHAMKADRDECLAAGMNGYLAKPFRAEELCEIVESAVETNLDALERGLPGPPEAGLEDSPKKAADLVD